MHRTPYESLVAFILSVDTGIAVYLLPIVALLSVGTVALLSRGRRPLELVAMFGIAFVTVLAGAWFVFHVLAHRPFFRLEWVQYP
ncbi:MAG: hypothetical protein H6697_00440 [Myxococcales bacterium]|nr:hypothetical protein [Myxococcales bacterium]MCB9520023.1 hypothetical protein [Myxococcales bacterium]